MRTITIRYFDEVEQGIYDYQYDYPTETELLQIFPEAKNIIPFKSNDWMKRKGKILAKETIPYLKKVNVLKDEFSRAFWKEVYAYLAGGLNSCVAHIKRLKRLESLMRSPEGSRRFEDLIKRAKETSLISVYEFQRLRKTGRAYTACCPIHNDKTPSFHIYSDNSWYCFGCNRGGDAIDFVQVLEKMDFRKAVHYLAGGVK